MVLIDGEKLKKKRLQFGYSQKSFAEKIGLKSDRAYRRIERSGVTSERTHKKILELLSSAPQDFEIHLKFFISDVFHLSKMPIELSVNLTSQLPSMIFKDLCYKSYGSGFVKVPSLRKMLNSYKSYYKDSENPLESLYVDLSWMKTHGWIQYIAQPSLFESEFQINLTFREKKTSDKYFHLNLLKQLESIKPTNEYKWVENMDVNLMTNVYDNIRLGEDEVTLKLVEDLAYLQKAGIIFFKCNDIVNLKKVSFTVL